MLAAPLPGLQPDAITVAIIIVLKLGQIQTLIEQKWDREETV